MSEPVLLLLMIIIVLFIFLLGLFFPAQNQTIVKPQKKSPPKQTIEVIESFDYHGIKIYQEKGAYNINDHGRVYHFGSLEELPSKYKKILQEIAHHSSGKPATNSKNVMLESNNGKYTFTDNKGNKQRLKHKSDLSEKLLRLFGGND